jgi:hypothetical protein
MRVANYQLRREEEKGLSDCSLVVHRFLEGPNAWLTGTGSRRLEGTNSGHKNAEGMPAVGVRVEPSVRLGSAVEAGGVT